MVRTLSPERKMIFLNSALALFVANGVGNTSTAEIAKAAGTAAGTLFLYFPTKQDLINELVIQLCKEQAGYIKMLLQPSLSARDAFFTIWSGSVRWFLDHMEAYQYIQQVRDSGMISESAVQETNTYLSYYYDAIQKGLQEGSIKPHLVGLVGAFLYQDIIAIMNYLRALPDASQQDETIRQGFEIFWDGIKSGADATPERR